jgi:hypothetical protein
MKSRVLEPRSTMMRLTLEQGRSRKGANTDYRTHKTKRCGSQHSESAITPSIK